MTQVNQAVGYKVEVEHFRRIRSECSVDTPGCNMGRMYWQVAWVEYCTVHVLAGSVGRESTV
jgi:hypothetical protein